jgi:alkylation response protein AidB-like acyl-CoA dehydrogenase
MQTTARFEDDEVVLNGEKTWVSSAHYDQTSALLVMTRFEEYGGEIGSVVVDTDAPGLEIAPTFRNMRSERQSQIFFSDCRVPRDNVVLAGENSFLEHLKSLNIERLGNPMVGLAMAQCAFDKAIDHAKDRTQFDQPIGDFQGIRWMIADMATKIDTARLLLYRAAANAVNETPSRLETSMAKAYANEIAEDVVSDALQIHGAQGYMDDSPLEYLYRAVRGQKIGGGTVEIHKNNVADHVLQDGLTSI